MLRGNIPDFLRTFQTITVKAKDAAGKERTATIEVMPDYLAVGSDADFVRVPMTPMTAARIADAFGCALPTRKVVDEVYRGGSGEARTEAADRGPRGGRDASSGTTRIIEEQRAGKKLGELVAGIKKDVVVTNRLAREAEPRRDLRLAQARRQADPAAHDRPRRPVRGLQPRRAADEAHGRRGRQAARRAPRAVRPRPVRAAERRGADHAADAIESHPAATDTQTISLSFFM